MLFNARRTAKLTKTISLWISETILAAPDSFELAIIVRRKSEQFWELWNKFVGFNYHNKHRIDDDLYETHESSVLTIIVNRDIQTGTSTCGRAVVIYL